MSKRLVSCVVLALVWLLTPGDALAQARDAWVLDVGVSGGFAGIRTEEVQSVPVTECETDANATQPVCTVSATELEFVRNSKFVWRPTLATGVVFWRMIQKHTNSSDERVWDPEGIGWGIGTHMTFLDNGASQKIAPALTLHFGKRKMHFFVGSVFMPTARVDFGGSIAGDRVRLPATTDAERFLRDDGAANFNLFAGIVVGGISILNSEQ